APQLRARDDMFGDKGLAQCPDHWGIGVAGMDDAAANTVKHGLLHQGCRGAFQARFSRCVSNLTLIAQGGNRANEYYCTLQWFSGLPALQVSLRALRGDPRDHFHGPIYWPDKIYLHDVPERFDRINRNLVGLLFDFNREAVAGDPGGGHADVRRPVFLRHFGVDMLTKCLVADVAFEPDRRG